MVFDTPNLAYVTIISNIFWAYLNMNTLAGRALNYHKVINDFVAKTHELQQYKLTSDDWNAI